MNQVPFPDRFHYASAAVDEHFGPLEGAPLDDGVKLVLYATRRQAQDGPCKDAAPWAWQVTERYKHLAWKELGQMSKVEAMVHFVQQADKILPDKWLDAKVQSSMPTVTPYEKPAVSPAAAAVVKEERQGGEDHDGLPDVVCDESVAWLRNEVQRLRRQLRELGATDGVVHAPSHLCRNVKFLSMPADAPSQTQARPCSPVPPPVPKPENTTQAAPATTRGATELTDAGVTSTFAPSPFAPPPPPKPLGGPPQAPPLPAEWQAEVGGDEHRRVGWLEWMGIGGGAPPPRAL